MKKILFYVMEIYAVRQTEILVDPKACRTDEIDSDTHPIPVFCS